VSGSENGSKNRKPSSGENHKGSWLIAAVVIGAALFSVLLSPDVPPPVIRGVPAPAFELADLDTGASISLAGLRDRVVLINFWATWCKPCEDEMPAMDRLYRSLATEGFELLAVSVDEETELVEIFRQRLGVSFPILMDPTQEISRLYQTTGFPESLLIDGDGMIVERYIGPRDWDHTTYAERIRRLMKKG